MVGGKEEEKKSLFDFSLIDGLNIIHPILTIAIGNITSSGMNIDLKINYEL